MSAEPAVSRRAWVAVIGGLFGCFMAGMNVHVTSAALPEIRGSLGASFEEGSWISTAYLVAEIVMIPLTAWLVEVFSMRRVMWTGSFIFLLASIACSWAPNLEAMIMIRVVQGAAGAVLIPLSFQLIITELPASKMAMGMALFSLANSVAQAAGPSIGGWLTDAYSWRWIFYLQLFPGIALLAAIAWSIDAKPLKLALLRQGDWLGIAAMVIGLGGLQIVLEEGGRLDWFASPFILGMSLVAAIALVVFVVTQLLGKRAFINLRLLGHYNFGVASVAMFIFGGATFGLVFLVPNYLSQIPRCRRGADRLRCGAVVAGAADAAADGLDERQVHGGQRLSDHGPGLLAGRGPHGGQRRQRDHTVDRGTGDRSAIHHGGVVGAGRRGARQA